MLRTTTIINGYADADIPTVTLHADEDMMVATWEGGPMCGIIARRIDNIWAVSSTTGWFDLVADRRQAEDRLVMSARHWF